MAKEFQLRVVTPERTVVDRQVRYTHFTGLDGGYGILANHAPMMTTVAEAGTVTFENTDGTREDLFISDGFAEMQNNVLTIVCEAGERADEIDLERAERQEREAREALAREQKLSSAALTAEAALRKAMIRELLVRKRGGTGGLR